MKVMIAGGVTSGNRPPFLKETLDEYEYPIIITSKIKNVKSVYTFYYITRENKNKWSGPFTGRSPFITRNPTKEEEKQIIASFVKWRMGHESI